MFLAAQIIGVIAVATYILSYQFKKRKNILFVNAISSVLYVLQYIMLGAFEGAAVDVLSTISTFAAQNKNKLKKFSLIVFIIINLSFMVSGIVLYKNVFSLFPVLGAMLQTGAFWLKNERNIRIVSFLGTPFWLVYNFICGAYGPTFGTVLSIISIGTAIIRYDIYPKYLKNSAGK